MSENGPPKHRHFPGAVSCGFEAEILRFCRRKMRMFQGFKNSRSLLGKSIRPRFTPTPKSPQAAGAARRSCRHGPAVTPGSRRERAVAAGRAPQSPKAAGAKRRGRRRDQSPQRPRAPTSAQRPQPTTAPSQAACSSVTAGRGAGGGPGGPPPPPPTPPAGRAPPPPPPASVS